MAEFGPSASCLNGGPAARDKALTLRIEELRRVRFVTRAKDYRVNPEAISWPAKLGAMMASSRDLSWRQECVLVLVGITLWLTAFPYRGIYHDGRVYTLFALARNHPEWYGSEIFLNAGKQSSFTIFPAIQASVIGWLGISGASLALTLLGGMAWVAASRIFTRSILSGLGGALVFLMLAGTWLPYHPSFSAYDFFNVAENFVSPRIWAASFVLVGLALQVGQGKRFHGFLMHAIGVLIHPLVGIWGLLAALLVELNRRDEKSLWKMSAVFVVTLFLTVLLPNELRMDREWSAIVGATDPSAFPSPWSRIRFGHVCWLLGVLIFSARYASGQLARLYAVTAWLLVTGLVTYGWIEKFPLQLLVQIQPWRVLWLATVLSIVGIIDWGIVAMRSSGRQPWVFLVVAALFFVRELAHGIPGVAVILLFAADRLVGNRLSLGLDSSTLRLARKGLLVVLCLLPIFWLGDRFLEFTYIGDGWTDTWGLMLFLTGFFRRGGFGIVPILAFICLSWIFLKPGRVRIGAALVSICLVAALANWDARRPWRIMNEEKFGEERHRPFDGMISHGDSVYWPSDPSAVWYMAGTANYLAQVQAYGVILSRPLAIELRRRLAAATDLAFRVDNQFAGEGSVPELIGADLLSAIQTLQQNSHEASAQDVERICRDPVLDWVVLDAELEEIASAQEVVHARGKGLKRYLISCKELRRHDTNRSVSTSDDHK